MEAKTWILVANSAEAKILFTKNLRVGEFELVQEIAHPTSRKKNSELVSDRPGRYKTSTGGSGAYDGKRDPKDIESEPFAIQLARKLKSGLDQHKFKELFIIAPAHFQGLLKKHFNDDFGHLKVTCISKDYTKYDLHKLHTSLKERLFG